MSDRKPEGLLSSFTRRLTTASSKDRAGTASKQDAPTSAPRILTTDEVLAIGKKWENEKTAANLKIQTRDSLPELIQQSFTKMKIAESNYLKITGNDTAKKEAFAAYEESAKVLQARIKTYQDLTNDAQLEQDSPMDAKQKQSDSEIIADINGKIEKSKKTVAEHIVASAQVVPVRSTFVTARPTQLATEQRKTTAAASSTLIQQLSQIQPPPTLEAMRSDITKQIDAVKTAWSAFDQAIRNNPKAAGPTYATYEEKLQQLEKSFQHYQGEAPRLLEQVAESAQNKAAAEHTDFATKTAASIQFNSPEKKRKNLRENINGEVSVINHVLNAPETTTQGQEKQLKAISGAQKNILTYQGRLNTLVELSTKNHPLSAAEAEHISAVNKNIEEVNSKAAVVLQANTANKQATPPPTSQL